MREFTDADRQAWIASVAEEDGPDYKGRFYLVLRPAGGGASAQLRDVRWNSRRTALRTIESMSVIELRRRLRAAVGRSAASATG